MSTKITNSVKNSVLTIPDLNTTLNYGQSVIKYGGSNYLIKITANQGYTFNGGRAPINYLTSVTGSNSSEQLTKVSDTEYTTRVDFSYYNEAYFAGEAITDESQVAYVNVTSNVTNCTVVSDVSEILAGTEVTINLNAADGYGFKVAPKITEGSTEINFTISENKLTASVTFTPNSDFTITASAVKFVKWTNNAKNCTVEGINNVLVGETVNITITPNNGYEITGTPNIDSYGTLYNFTVGDDGIARLTKKLRNDDEQLTINAKTQAKISYLNVTSNVTNCTVVSDVSKILAGTEVTINLNAADGYGFKVAPKITEGTTEINFTISENKLTASVTFTPNSDFTITANGVKFVIWDIAGVKNCTVDGINNVLVGDTVNITITPNSGYVFDSVPYINRYGTLNYFTVGTDNIARLENIKLANDDENISVVAKTKVSEDVTPTTKTGFLRIYTPTDEQLDLLADYGGINPSTQDTLNMTNYIYGLYKVFVPITPDGEADIYLARNDTKVKSNYVNSENIEIESDEIEIPIKFNNVFDFSPYTKANIYLPFIGNVNFDTDVLRAGKLKIKYNANLLNLNTLATILVDGKEIDYHTGKCGFNIPFNLSSYAYNVNNLSSNNYLTDLTPKVILINSIPYDNGNDFIGRDIHKYLNNAETLKGLNSCEVIKFAENSFITESEKDEIINLLRTGIYF